MCVVTRPIGRNGAQGAGLKTSTEGTLYFGLFDSKCTAENYGFPVEDYTS